MIRPKRRRRRVISPSQRGRGLSDWDPVVERHNPATYKADMLALLDHLGIVQAVFMGTSMGGLMTMMAAHLSPGRLCGAVLNDVGPEIGPAGLERIRGYVGGATEANHWTEAAKLCRDINGPAFPGETGDAVWENFARKIFREKTPGRIVLDYDPEIARTVREGSGQLADLWPGLTPSSQSRRC